MNMVTLKSLLFKMLSVLERRGEGILISLDVKGAFDRVWWVMLKAELEARGLTGDALELVKDYLFKRFLRVVCQVDQSTKMDFFLWSTSRGCVVTRSLGL